MKVLAHEEHAYLKLLDSTSAAALALLREKALQRFSSPQYVHYHKALDNLPDLVADQKIFDQPAVSFIRNAPLTKVQQEKLEQSLRVFCPWKKGPFHIFGIDIDAEWRSDWKWERIVTACGLSSFRGQVIADLGCHNGYFMFRLLEAQPRFVVGFEPVAKNYFHFLLLQRYAQQERICFEPFGVEALSYYRDFFDVILCLGLVYHRQDPLGMLRDIYAALKPGGLLLIESQGLGPQNIPLALVPQKTYARAKGVWFVPNSQALSHWLSRSQFEHIECFYEQPLSCHEQRRTSWADIDSLAEFLHPDDPSQTCEGYPAPWRLYLRARKPGSKRSTG